jgi:hypothetical protein
MLISQSCDKVIHRSNISIWWWTKNRAPPALPKSMMLLYSTLFMRRLKTSSALRSAFGLGAIPHPETTSSSRSERSQHRTSTSSSRSEQGWHPKHIKVDVRSRRDPTTSPPIRIPNPGMPEETPPGRRPPRQKLLYILRPPGRKKVTFDTNYNPKGSKKW